MNIIKNLTTALALIALSPLASAALTVDNSTIDPGSTVLLQAHYKAGRQNSWSGDWLMGMHHGTTTSFGNVGYGQSATLDYSPNNFFTVTTDSEWKPGYSQPGAFTNNQPMNFTVTYSAPTGEFKQSLVDNSGTTREITWNNPNFAQSVNANFNYNKLTLSLLLRSDTGYGWSATVSDLAFAAYAGNAPLTDMNVTEGSTSASQSIISDAGTIGSFVLTGKITPKWNGNGANDFGKNNFFQFFVSQSNIPEPASISILSLGALALIRRKK